MKKNQIWMMLLVITHSLVLRAQDPHFSQYFSSPMTVNPALIGKDIGDWRFSSVFRSQWWSASVSPYNTTAVSIEKSLRSGGEGKSVFGIGFSVLSDVSNDGLLKNNYFTLGAAYNIALDGAGSEFLGVGLEGTYANRIIDASKFEFQSQFGSMGFQRTAPSGDPVATTSNRYWDVNMGVHYSKRFRTFGIYLGTGIFHGASPEEGFYNDTRFNVSRRYNLRAAVQFFLNNGHEIQTTAMTDIQGQNSIYTLGGVYKAKLADKGSLNIGLWYRFTDSFYPYLGLETKNWCIGLSYDVVSNQIRDSFGSVQSMEMSFTWLFGKKRDPLTRPENMIPY